MIEKMKSVCVVTSELQKTKMLNEIRKMGVLHVCDRKPADSSETERFDSLSRTCLMLSEYPQAKYDGKILSDKQFEKLNATVLEAVEMKAKFTEDKASYSIEAESVQAWGDFEPSLITQLKEQGIDLYFYKLGKKEFALLQKEENVKFISLKSVDKMQAVAVLDKPLDKNFPATEFTMPLMSYSKLCEKIAECDNEIAKYESVIVGACAYLSSYKDQIIKCKNSIAFSSVNNTSSSEDGLVWISGFIPESEEETFVKFAKTNHWAYVIDEPEEDDERIPTKVKYTKLTGLMKPVFDILGTVPGYHEYDISFWFLCFFTLFFAMIVGDGGYGLIFLAAAVGMHIKDKKTNDAILLLYVLSIANVAWGAVTGTWFGLESAMKVPFIKALVIPSIANYPQYFGIDSMTAQNNVMQFCFIIGTIQLSLACIMNIRTKIKAKDLSWVSDLGWLSAINALYYVVLLLVIGAEVNVVPAFAFVILGFVLVVLFGGMSPDKTFGQGLKSGLADAFTVFLNTISAFGNVMSYIRLFAVGMASLAIAQSFNSMAGGFSGILKVAGIIIFVIGHALNLVMALLSVVVHGVRLNLLEFSGQLGMEWSGIAYEPFSEIKK